MVRGKPRDQRPFAEALAVARPLGLRTKRDWAAWARTNAHLLCVPVRPDLAYAREGWVSWPHFLHDGPTLPRFRPFDDARRYARRLDLRTKRDWAAWAATDEHPRDIPARPDHAYAGDGWLSWPDFLGRVPTSRRPVKVPRCSPLRLMRAQRHLRLSDVARAVSVSVSHLGEVERAVKRPSPALLRRLADYYGTTPAEIRAAIETETTPPTPAVRVRRLSAATAAVKSADGSACTSFTPITLLDAIDSTGAPPSET